MRLLEREDWLARQPTRSPRPVSLERVQGMVLHHNGPEMNWASKPSVLVRSIQNYHMGVRGWSDIAYSFVVAQDGTVFQGRGWDWDEFAQLDEGADLISVMWLGGGHTESRQIPSQAAYDAIRELRVLGCQMGMGTRVWPHNAFQRKPCPGPELTLFAQTLNDEDPIMPQEEEIEDLWAEVDALKDQIKSMNIRLRGADRRSRENRRRLNSAQPE